MQCTAQIAMKQIMDPKLDTFTIIMVKSKGFFGEITAVTALKPCIQKENNNL